MKVYIVVNDMGYDGQYILAVFSSPELAYAWTERREPKWVKHIDKYHLDKYNEELYYYSFETNMGMSSDNIYLEEFELDEEEEK